MSYGLNGSHPFPRQDAAVLHFQILFSTLPRDVVWSFFITEERDEHPGILNIYAPEEQWAEILKRFNIIPDRIKEVDRGDDFVTYVFGPLVVSLMENPNG